MGHHHHHHPEPPRDFSKAFLIAICANLAFTGLEALYAILSNSSSLLADAGHNLGDVIGLLVAWLANWLLSFNARGRFSFGFQRTTILAAVVNAVLLVVASIYIVMEAVEHLFHPQPVQEMTVIIVAAIGVIINAGTAVLFMRGNKADLNIRGAYLHLAYDALISIGVVITGIIILFTGWTWLDPLFAIVIVLTIVIGTWGLLRQALNLLLDAVPHWIEPADVETVLLDVPGIYGVHHLHIWGLSTQAAALTAHVVTVDGMLSNQQRSDIETRLKQQFRIEHTTLQAEHCDDPDLCPVEAQSPCSTIDPPNSTPN